MMIDTQLNPEIKLQKVRVDAIVPTYGTEKSACFDLYACMRGEVKVWGGDNFLEKVNVLDWFVINTNERVLIPTGFIFGIPEGYSMRIHPRSGLSLKNGITLANCEAAIDCDYPEETFVMLTNISEIAFKIEHGMRIAQAEIVRDRRVTFNVVDYNPAVKTDRVSGLGSTGVN